MANLQHNGQINQLIQPTHPAVCGISAALKALYRVPPVQHGQSESGHRNCSVSSTLSLKHHPIDFQLDATWLCDSCNTVESFVHVNFRRPLGIMKCPHCKACAGARTRISGFEFKLASASRFLVSIPAVEVGPPQSNIVWVCCQCGRSHAKHWREMRQGPNLMSQHDNEAVGNIKRRIRERWKKLTHTIAYHVSDVEVSEPTYEPLPERPIFSTTLDKKCRCGHATCSGCLIICIPGVDEFVAHGAAELEATILKAETETAKDRENLVADEAVFSMIGLPGVARPYRSSEGRNSGMVWIHENDGTREDRWIGYLAR